MVLWWIANVILLVAVLPGFSTTSLVDRARGGKV